MTCDKSFLESCSQRNIANVPHWKNCVCSGRLSRLQNWLKVTKQKSSSREILLGDTILGRRRTLLGPKNEKMMLTNLPSEIRKEKKLGPLKIFFLLRVVKQKSLKLDSWTRMVIKSGKSHWKTVIFEFRTDKKGPKKKNTGVPCHLANNQDPLKNNKIGKLQKLPQ